jgi:hypothetical protein
MPPTVRADRTAATPVITWARTWPAVPAQVGEARRFLAGLLDGGPAAETPSSACPNWSATRLSTAGPACPAASSPSESG